MAMLDLAYARCLGLIEKTTNMVSLGLDSSRVAEARDDWLGVG